MKPVDSTAFGRRVKERREELGLSQEDLGAAAGFSQSNIGWLESGGAKKPQRVANELAAALQTTREWLLWKEGPKQVGPRYLAPDILKKIYAELPPDAKALITQATEKAVKSAHLKRVS